MNTEALKLSLLAERNYRFTSILKQITITKKTNSNAIAWDHHQTWEDEDDGVKQAVNFLFING